MNESNTLYINKKEKEKQKKKKKIKNQLREIEKNEERLNELVQQSGEHIFEAKAVFPFDLFPDRITIDANKVTVIQNSMLSSNEFPIPAGKITNIEVFYGIFFGSIRLEVFGYSEPPPDIAKFTKRDTRLIKRYVTGLIRVYDENIDLTGMNVKELRAKLQEIGKKEGEEIMDHS